MFQVVVKVAEREDKWLFEICTVIEFFVTGEIGFVDFQVVSFFKLKHNLAVND
jgi:hypothetical protein